MATEELTDAARTVGELAAGCALTAERAGRLTAAVGDAIVGAGFPRHFVAARWGGTEGTFVDYLDAAATLAERDPSAAWVASIVASLGRMAGYLPEAGQAALWGDGPDTFLTCALVAGGSARAVPGGWEVSGVWPYLSGVEFSRWSLAACPVPTPDGVGEVRFLLVPRSQYTIEHTWSPVGMRATGSDSIRLQDVFVPVEHTFGRQLLLEGTPAGPAPASAAVPLKVVSGLSFAGPMLGMARGALHAFVDGVAAKRAAGGPANRVYGGSDVSVDLALARTAGEIDAAGLLLERTAEMADDGVRAPADVARIARDHVLVADMLIGAVNRLFRLSGTSAHDDGADLQRFWRDIAVAGGHPVLQFEPTARAYAESAVARAVPSAGVLS